VLENETCFSKEEDDVLVGSRLSLENVVDAHEEIITIDLGVVVQLLEDLTVSLVQVSIAS